MKLQKTNLLSVLFAALVLAGTARAQYLTNSFTTQDNVTNSPLAGFMLNLGNTTNLVAFTTNGAVFLNANGVAGSQDSQRNYVTTSDYTTYDQTNFEASVDVSVAGAFAPFFGIGDGMPVGANWEPLNSLYIRARLSGGAATVQGTGGEISRRSAAALPRRTR
jgi:sugar lactone lactonase YvrE